MTELTAAHTQWANRPSDERYESLADLSAATHHYRDISREIERLPVRSLSVTNDMHIVMPSGMQLEPTNWSFAQLAHAADAPAEYLKRLPTSVAAFNLNVGLRQAREDISMLFSHNGHDVVRSMNGVNYGRIWDSDVVDAVMNNVDDCWQVPLDAYNGVMSKQATTLYASDRDVFIFLTDQTRPVELDGQTYFRGFYVWNSEVGSATFGIATLVL